MDKSSTKELEKQIEQNAEQINKLIGNKAAKELEIDELNININAENKKQEKDFLIKRMIAIRKKYINDTNLQIETLKNLNKTLSLEVQKIKRLKESLLKSERLKQEREREEKLMLQDVVDDKNELSKSEPLKPMSSINYQDDEEDNDEDDDEDEEDQDEQLTSPPVSPTIDQSVSSVSIPSANPSIATQMRPFLGPNKPIPNKPIPNKPTLKSKPKTITNKTRKARKNPSVDDIGIELKEFPSTSPKIVKDLSKSKLGFSETLKISPNRDILKSKTKRNPNICQNIFMNGLNVTKKYFYPSQFPNITRIKPIAVTMKKGGKRKSRKNIKK